MVTLENKGLINSHFINQDKHSSCKDKIIGSGYNTNYSIKIVRSKLNSRQSNRSDYRPQQDIKKWAIVMDSYSSNIGNCVTTAKDYSIGLVTCQPFSYFSTALQPILATFTAPISLRIVFVFILKVSSIPSIANLLILLLSLFSSDYFTVPKLFEHILKSVMDPNLYILQEYPNLMDFKQFLHWVLSFLLAILLEVYHFLFPLLHLFAILLRLSEK